MSSNLYNLPILYMSETIKEIYNSITILFKNLASNFIGGKFNNSMLKHLEYSLNNALIAKYPYYKFNPKIEWNHIDGEIFVDLNPDFNTFPGIGYKNYHTHDFVSIEIENTYFINPLLKCNKCKLLISSSGTLIDGDYSCNEFLIKKMLE